MGRGNRWSASSETRESDATESGATESVATENGATENGDRGNTICERDDRGFTAGERDDRGFTAGERDGRGFVPFGRDDRGFTVSMSYAILAVALLLATVTLYGAVFNAGEQLLDARKATATQFQQQASTHVNLSMVNLTLGKLTVNVTNTGTHALAVDDTDVVVNGTYYPQSEMVEVTVDGDDSDVWEPANVLQLEFRQADPVRLQVVAEHGVAEFERLSLRRTRVAYVSGGTLTAINPSGATTTFSTATVDGLGDPNHDIDTDVPREVPFVTTNPDLKIVDDTGHTRTLDDRDDIQGTHLGVGDWDDDGRVEVLYVRDSTSVGSLVLTEAQVNSDGTIQTDTTTAIVPASIAGVSAFDSDDSDTDVVYVDDTNEIQYLSHGATTPEQAGTITVAAKNAIGRPADYDDDGQPEIPIIKSQSNDVITLVDASGEDTADSASPVAVNFDVASESMGAFDWDNDGTPEAVVFDAGGQLHAIDFLSGESYALFESDGETVTGDDMVGAG